MDELAADVNAEAEMSKRTVYRYFRSKDEIIEATVEKLLHQASTYVIKTVEEAETSEEALTKLLNAFLDLSHKYITYQLMEDMSSHYPHIWRKIDEFRAKNAVLIVKSMYKKGAGKEFREINPLIAVEVVKASIQAVLNPDFILQNNLTSEKTIEQLLSIFKNGFLK